MKPIPTFYLVLFGLSIAGALAGLVWLVFLPGLSGPFLLDDFANLVGNPGLSMAREGQLVVAALSHPPGSFPRPLSMGSFALDVYWGGGVDPRQLKAGNLVIHLVNGFLLCFLSALMLSHYFARRGRSVSRRQLLALSGGVALLWALHPLNLTPVLYTVQRMTSLASLFMLLGMLAYVWARGRNWSNGERVGRLVFWGCLPLFGTLAYLSKEIGVLLPLYILAVEACIFRFSAAEPGKQREIRLFHVIYVAAPVLLAVAYIGVHWSALMGGYETRMFSLGERLLTQPRVLWFYLRLIFLPDIGSLGLFHDDFAVSRTLFEPWTTLPAVLGLIALLAFAIKNVRLGGVAGFGIIWFLVGHSLEGSFLPLEMVFEHRNYLPMAGALIAFGAMVFERFDQISRPALWISCGALVFYCGLITHIRANQWGGELSLGMSEAEHHPASARAQGFAGQILTGMLANYHDEELFGLARQHLLLASQLDPGHPRGLAGLIRLYSEARKPLDPGWFPNLNNLYRESRLAPDSLAFSASLLECKRRGSCRFPDGELVSMYEAILKNPMLTLLQRADALAQYADYLAYQLHQFDAALPMLKESVQIAPGSLDYRMSLAQLLIVTRQFDAARREIVRLAADPRIPGYSKRIQYIQRLLSEAESPHAR